MKKRFIFFLFFIVTIDIILGQERKEFLLSNDGIYPSMSMSNNNMFVVWQNPKDSCIYFQKYDSLGYKVSDSIMVTKDIFACMQNIMVNDNYAVVVWREVTIFFNDYITGKIINLNDTSFSDVIFLNDSYGDANRFEPLSCFLNDTTFIVSWYGNGIYTPSPATGIYAQKHSIKKSIDSIILLTDHITENVRHSKAKILNNLDNNGYITIWIDNNNGLREVYGRLFNYNGSPVDSSFLISDENNISDVWTYDAAIDTNGDFCVIWSSTSDSINYGIRWRWYDKAGNPITGNEVVIAEAENIFDWDFNITMNIEGKFIISWPEWEGNHVKKFFIQRFDKYRNKIGEKFKVGTNDTINISNITLNLNNNSIYIVYNKFFDNVNNGIYSQIIDFNNPPSHIDIKNKSNIPKDFILFQNYPNPFNPTTTISYQLPVFSNIVIKVYDILGQEITTLVNENKNPGKYSVEFNAIYLSSGVYFVVLTTNEKRAVIKTLLLK